MIKEIYAHGGPFQECLWAINFESSQIFTFEWNKYLYIEVKDIGCGISKGIFEIPHKIPYTYIGSEWLNLVAFLGQQCPYKPCTHNLYIGRYDF